MTDNWWHEYRQNRRISELRDDLSSVHGSLATARSQTRNLQSKLSAVTGTIERRVDRLSAAFDAFVEISDLRVTLSVFGEQARARHQARLFIDGSVRFAEVPDVAGYWLPPALVALRAAAEGEGAAGALAEARSRDGLRAAIFHSLGAATVGRGNAVTAEQLATALPALSDDMPLYVRALWTLAADGHFGAAGRELLVRRGVEYQLARPAQQRDAAVAAWHQAAVPEEGQSFRPPRELGDANELTYLGHACDRLAVLREWVSESLGATTQPPAEPEPEVTRALLALVDEGSPEELPLLARERELRKVIEDGDTKDGATKRAHWDDGIGRTAKLLADDAVNEQRPGRRAVAVRAQAADIVAAAESLAEKSREPLPDRVTVRALGNLVTITPQGPDPASLQRAMTRVTAADPDTDARKAMIGGGVAGALLVVLALVAGWGWLVPAAIAFGVAGWYAHAERRRRAVRAETGSRNGERLSAAVRQSTQAFVEALADLRLRRARVDDDLAAVRSLLAAAPASVRGEPVGRRT